MKALVTGGAGFIGGHLVERLLVAGHQVVAVDDLSGGSVENLDAALGRYGFLLRVVDMLDADALSDCFTGVDWVFHLAGTGSGLESLRRSKPCLLAHVQATHQLLECARHFGVRSFVYAAASSCYGDPGPEPVSERAALRPGHPHAVSKALGEQLALQWGAIYEIPTVSLRLFNVYGTRDRLSPRSGSVTSVFLAQRAARAPLTLAGDGQQLRDFVHVEDVTRALLRAAEERVAGEVLNIGSGHGTSIARLAELVGGEIAWVPERPGSARTRVADIALAAERLGWAPEIGIEDGIRGLLMQLSAFEAEPVWSADGVARMHERAVELRGARNRTSPGAWASPGGPPTFGHFPIL